MKLDKANMRKMRQLILFTVIILIALWNYEMIFGAIRFAFGIIFPFLLGGGIAFVLNVPMSFFEEKLFYNRYLKDKKIANRIARPVSLVLTIAVLIGVIVLVMFVVIPELTKTVISLGKTIQTFIPEAQRFLEELFTDNSEVRAWLEGLNLNLDQLVDQAVSFFQNGAGNILNSTMSAIGSIVSGVTTFVIAFVFACYVLLQKEKLFSLEEASQIIAFSAIFGVLGTVTAGWLSDSVFRSDRIKPAILSGILSFVSLALFLFSDGSYIVNILYISLFSLSIGVLYCIVAGLMAVDIVPRKATGAALGIVGISSYIAAGIQDIASGYLIDGNMQKTTEIADAVYNFTPVSVFWLTAALISFLLPVLNWKKMMKNQ